MKKIYLLLVSTSLFVCTAMAQRPVQSTNTYLNKTKLLGNPSNNYQQKTTTDCDTVNTTQAAAWTPQVYTVTGGGGYVAGVNEYGDEQKAAYFNLASYTNSTYLTGVAFWFAKANSTNPASLSKTVPVKVYDGDATNGPNNLLGTNNSLTLGSIKTDVSNSDFTIVQFTTPISIPASKKIFISIDLSNFTWGSSTKDSLSLVTSEIDEAGPSDNGGGWDFYSGSWSSMEDGWGSSWGLMIFPVVCNSIAPVTFVSFNGEKVESNNILSWATATEMNNTGFELQRSINGIEFSTIAFIPTKAENGNSNTNLSYTYTDKTSNTSAYYKLKQIDKDGKYSYSKTVFIKADKPTRFELVKVYPNPTRDIVKVSVIAPKASNATLTITDMTGKTVMQQNIQLTMGDNNVALNTQSLNAGNYIIKLTCAEGCESSISRFVKQ